MQSRITDIADAIASLPEPKVAIRRAATVMLARRRVAQHAYCSFGFELGISYYYSPKPIGAVDEGERSARALTGQCRDLWANYAEAFTDGRLRLPVFYFPGWRDEYGVAGASMMRVKMPCPMLDARYALSSSRHYFCSFPASQTLYQTKVAAREEGRY